MEPKVGGITLGVSDLDRAKQFYGKGLGWPVQQEQGEWVSFGLNDGSLSLGLYPWNAVADDAGVAADGSGFRGFMFSHVVQTQEQVDAVLTQAQNAGGE